MSIRGMVLDGRKPGKGFDEWMTPPNVIELARTAMGSIDFDPASNPVAQEYVKAKQYCVAPDSPTAQMLAEDIDGFARKHFEYLDNVLIDGLKQPWHGNVWCNPPYSAGNIDLFVDRAIDQYNSGSINQMLMLVNSATDTKWYHKLIRHSQLTMLWRGRIKFWKIMNGKAYEKWEGEKSKKEGKGKIGNSPRYLNTLFYFGHRTYEVGKLFNKHATILMEYTG